jgi:CspA family cold shock protein
MNVHLSKKGTAPMNTGTVKWFNETKGYGFIQPDAGGKDVFVHISAVERSGMRGLRDGQKINYELETDRRTGRQSAVNLQAA